MILLAGCGIDAIKGNSSETETVEKDKKKQGKSKLGDYNIKIDGEVIEKEDKFIIKGTSNLIPGTRLVGESWVSEDELFSDTTELVQDDGSFQMELEHHQYGEAEFIVRFDFKSAQEDFVKRHYGEQGQNLEGPFVYKHEVMNKIYKKAEASVKYDPNNERKLTFKAPEWIELPEDYGDPRVWIEVDEITEDGEFYYLSGKSNLLEGSKIKGSFGWNNDETRVLPDGTFDLKIEYEYKEGEDFVLKFDPQYQWNEIEEAYGSKGQKLVGNLVVTNKYSDKQTIEKVIPWEK